VLAPGRKRPKGTPAVVTVKNLHDNGAGSLRAAVEYANSHPNSTINFAGLLSGTIKLTSGELAITQSTIIDGNKARGGDAHTTGPPSHGGDGQGGGIYQGSDSGSKTTLTACSITHNRAGDGKGKHSGSDGQGVGGGPYKLGTVAVDPATVISKNHASTSNENVYP
jgi:hypothetical protein